MATTAKNEKYVYSFGGGKADGNESMKNLLGGKGANLAEMAGHKDLKLPVPPGFTITTEVCTYFYDNKRQYPSTLEKQIKDALAQVETDYSQLRSMRSGQRRRAHLTLSLIQREVPCTARLPREPW